MMDVPESNSGNAAPQCGSHTSRSGERRTQKSAMEWYSRGYLPHFDSPHFIQHITYRLADSLPRAVLEQLQDEVKASVQSDEKRKAELRQRIERYLDAGSGSCILREPEVATCVTDTWFRFDGERYRLLEWVVMPNHCHVLIEPFAGFPLGKIVLSWKNYTARFINEYKRRNGAQTQEGSPVWQREYWDRFIRDERHFVAARSYIILNPVKAGLVSKPADWLWSSAKGRLEDGT